MSRKYRVEQRFTTGWSVINEKAIKLSKDEARKWLEQMMNEGVFLEVAEDFDLEFEGIE